MTDIDEMGPVDYLVVEFPRDRQPSGSALPILRDLAAAGIIRVLDLAFIAKDEDGNIAGVNISETGLQGEFDMSLFAEAGSGLLDQGDLDEAGVAIEPGCLGAVLVYENSWAAPFAKALRDNGAQLVATGRVPVQALLATLDQLDASE